MKPPTLRPGQRITYLANPDSKWAEWRQGTIENVLSSQITFERQHSGIGFLMNADYGRLWRVK